MLKGGIPIGRAFGIDLRLHYSWFFIFALVTWALVANYFPTVYPEWTFTEKLVSGLVTSVLFFASVLAHELMHSIVALREGIKVESIVLFALGGVSQMSEEPKKPLDEFRMAIAGPGTSIVLGGIFWGIFFATRTAPEGSGLVFVAAVSYWLGLINIALGLFNLIPGFPLDGGRVFRSLVWWRTGNIRSATRLASNIGRGVGFLFIFGGVFLIFTGNLFNGIWFAIIGWFLESAAVGSYRQLLLQDLLKGHVASEIMTRDCQLVPPDITVERLVNDQILSTGRRCYPVVSGEKVTGMMTVSNIRTIPRERWNNTLVKEAMTPLENLMTVQPDTDLNTVLQLMAKHDINQLPVIQNRQIVGMVGRDNVINFINTRQEFAR